jgi:hypothetical protein
MSASIVSARSVTPWSWVLSAVFALAGFWLFTRHQDFPYLYHTDEPSKTEQIIQQKYNFHHPLLLLRTTEVLVHSTGTPLEPQPVVEKGRLASAIFAALATGAMVLLATRLAGWPAGMLSGALVLTHPVLFELSHYMKEDCALLLGISLTAVALISYAAKPTVFRAVCVGVCAGLAICGKYLGCTVAIFALLALAWNPTATGRRWLVVALASFALVSTFIVVNYPGLREPERVQASLAQELDRVGKRAEERPEAIRFKHLSKIGTTLSIPLLIGLGYWATRRWKLRQQEPVVLRALGLFLVAYFLVVSLAPKTKDRYLLPVYILACVLGAAGLVEWMRRSREHPHPVLRFAPQLLAVVAVGLHLPGLIGTYRAFQRDDRRELAQWIQANVPPGAAVAHDVRVLLGRAKEAGLGDFVLPNPILTPPDRYVADLGTVEELRSRGITHVAVCEADYHNAGKQKDDKMRARAKWYASLFEHQRLVWETRPGPVAYLQPGLRLYELVHQ